MTLTNFHEKDFIPGTLMSCQLEESKSSEAKEDASLYQADLKKNPEYVIRDKEGAEVFFFEHETEQSLLRFRDEGMCLDFTHRPSKMVFLHVDKKIWGPFYTNLERINYKEDLYECNIKSDSKQKMIYSISEENFFKSYKPLEKEFLVALDNNPVKIKNHIRKEKIIFLTSQKLENIKKDILDKVKMWEHVDFESLATKIYKAAEYFKSFTKQERKKLRDLLRTLEKNIYGSNDSLEAIEYLKDATRLNEQDEQNIDKLLSLLYNTYIGDTDTGLEKAKKACLNEHIQKNTHHIQEKIHDKEKELQKLEEEFEQRKIDIELELEEYYQDELAEWERTKKDTFDSIAKAKKDWEKIQNTKETELLRRETMIQKTLENLQNLSAQNMSQLITIFPFLQKLQIEQETKYENKASHYFTLPNILTQGRKNTQSNYSEKEFLSNFQNYVQARGFKFHASDLRRFHCSVKCSDITILAGHSGVGKSSLALLYGDILAGKQQEISSTKMIHVNPSWIEKADIIGYINTVTQDFVPAETNLFQQLIFAQEDFFKNVTLSSIYPICFDEMNLAQIEHYFSDFMQILELPTVNRQLPCFSPDALTPESGFKKYHTLFLAPTIKFIGTVNFDETTRRLSDRLLDRTNLLNITSPEVTYTISDRSVSLDTPRVTYSTYEQWCKDKEMSQDLLVILNEIRPFLKILNLVISPRVYCAIRKYIASTQSLDISPLVALDEQLAQRVLSKLRLITNYQQIDALKKLKEYLKTKGEFQNSMAMIHHIETQESLWHDSMEREL